MVRKFPVFPRFSLIFFKKVPFSRFSLSCTNPGLAIHSGNCSIFSNFVLIIDLVLSISVNSKPDHPGDSHIFIAQGVGFLPICYCLGEGFKVLNKRNIRLLKKSNFLFVLKNRTAANKAMFEFLYFYTTFCKNTTVTL